MDAATRPPTAAPSENPQIIIVTAPARRRRGMYSEVRAMAFGIAPPIPRPVKARKAISDSTDWAVAVSSEPTPKISAHATSTGLRPMRSARGPLTSAPIIIPTSPLEITEPSTPREIFSAAVSAGATKPIACASKPSTNTIRPHIIPHRRILRQQQPTDERAHDRADAPDTQRPPDAGGANARGIELRGQRMRRILSADDAHAGARDRHGEQRDRCSRVPD